MASISVELLINELNNLIKQLQEQQDDSHGRKLTHLKHKLEQDGLSIALCGHFSAGKSTLINTLCEAKLLPSSPIPTSANIVTLAYGEEPQAEVEIMHNSELRTAIVPIDQLANYCLDGETYTSVKITYPSPLLKKGIILLDTPGIDSTDDAHRLSTESALHLADVVFYVMDYNHVQSEINFAFAKQLKEWRKPLYFIVNQIDKHREEELLFEDYRQSVWDAFQAWHLEPSGILYLSLKNPEHQHHQWSSLIHLCDQLVVQAEALKLESVKASLAHIINEHIEVNELKDEASLDQALKHLGGKEHIEQVITQIEQLLNNKTQLNEEKDAIIPQYRVELDTILKNANITPAVFRDKVHLFLESRKPGFKQGFLFTKSKTESEQQQRLTDVYNQLTEIVDSNIVWHIQQSLRAFLKPFNIEMQLLDQWLQSLEDCLPKPEYLIDQISTGAVFDNAYTLTYCTALSDSLKRLYREKTISILENIINITLAFKFSEQVQKIEDDIAKLEQQLKPAFVYFEVKEKHAQYKEALLSRIKPIVEPSVVKLPSVEQHLEQTGLQHSFVEQKQHIVISQIDDAISDQTGIEQVNSLKQQYQIVSDKLSKGTSILNQVEQLKPLAERLQQKTGRLTQLNFTISLFGAFSAGKSSLANALIGDAVLPVSPNPTTAAINSILPPNEKHKHNTATIYMKTEQVMLEDLIYSLKLLGLYSFEEKISKDKIFEIIDKIKPEDVANSGRAHYSFVKAARKGWVTEGQYLGQTKEVDRDQYIAYVAEESLSCFVQEIKFYYDCPLTASGIVLVDTPGADSVNARHTGVAFNYIKNTDAIIFVTYYNHAFSHADRQFLDQLGRVKDQFELDKMFFVVNAADLAASEEELKGVLKHVETNLEAHQIRNPRLYPVSSLMALSAKQQHDEQQLVHSGLFSFEQQFYSFIQVELGQIVVKSALKEFSRVKQEVTYLFERAKADLNEKDRHLTRLTQLESTFFNYVEGRLEQAVPDSLAQEVNELTYYIVQRLQLRFTDFYNYAINPSVIKENGLSMQQVLFTAWLELERTLALELKQELLATTLRIEKFIHRLIEEQTVFINQWLEEHDLNLSLSYNPVTLQQPQERQDWSLKAVTSKWLWSYFKSPKQFFEQQGKQRLRIELEPLIFESIKQWMSDTATEWKQFYQLQYKAAYTETLASMKLSTSRYIEQSIMLLNDESYMKQIEQIVTKLDKQN